MDWLPRHAWARASSRVAAGGFGAHLANGWGLKPLYFRPTRREAAPRTGRSTFHVKHVPHVLLP